MDDWRITSLNGKYDLGFIGGDIEKVTTDYSTRNGILLNIMTRLGEIHTPTYADYGCRVHELVKAPSNNLLVYKIKGYTEEVLKSMERIKKVNDITVTMVNENHYRINFDVELQTGGRIRGEYNV